MSKQEQAYFTKVKGIINKGGEPLEIIEELVAVTVPNTDTSHFNLNVLTFFGYMCGLEWDYNTGEQYNGFTGEENEHNQAAGVISDIKQILSDIDNGNEYKEVFTVELAYSRLKDGEYLYEIIQKPIDATTRKEAFKQRDNLKQSTTKTYPKDPSFTLEDVRLIVELIDSKNKRVTMGSVTSFNSLEDDTS